MKATGITRRVDSLGRVVVPKELRRALEIENPVCLEMYIEGELIYMKKHFPPCFFCDSTENVQEYRDKLICSNCLDNIKKL